MDKLKFNNNFDFFYNNHWASEFNIIVGGKEPFKLYSVLPSREYITDKSIGQNGVTVYATSLEPRVIEFPIFCEDLSDFGIRKLANWLNSPTPSPLYFKDEPLAIDVVLDSQAFDLETLCGVDGNLTLKFISHSVYYYQREKTTKTLTSATSGTAYTFENDSTAEIEPFVQVGCSGTLKIEVMDSNNNILSTTNITNITGGVKLNCETLECTLLSGASHFANIDTFPKFPIGDFKMKFTGTNITNVVVEYTKKYI